LELLPEKKISTVQAIDFILKIKSKSKKFGKICLMQIHSTGGSTSTGQYQKHLVYKHY